MVIFTFDKNYFVTHVITSYNIYFSRDLQKNTYNFPICSIIILIVTIFACFVTAPTSRLNVLYPTLGITKIFLNYQVKKVKKFERLSVSRFKERKKPWEGVENYHITSKSCKLTNKRKKWKIIENC